jgi:hypothetical protein
MEAAAPLDRTTSCRKLTSDVDSSQDLNRPEAKRFHAELTDLNILGIDLVKVFINLLEAENLKSEYLADEDTAFVPDDLRLSTRLEP